LSRDMSVFYAGSFIILLINGLFTRQTRWVNK